MEHEDIFSTTAVDDQAMHGARALPDIVLPQFSQNILVSSWEWYIRKHEDLTLYCLY